MQGSYQSLSLDGTWSLARFEVRQGTLEAARAAETIPCTVPGDIHNDLQAAGEIANPLTGLHMPQNEPYEHMEWWYRRDILLAEKSPGVQYALRFEGINIHGRIYFNGHLLGETENAFTPYEYDVTDFIQAGKNDLMVAVDCGLYTLCDDKELTKYDPHDPANEVEGGETEFKRLYLRKSQFEYNWDWARRLVTTGIWRHTELRMYKAATIEDVYVYDHFHDEDTVTIMVESTIRRWDETVPLRLVVETEGHGVQLAATEDVSGETTTLSLKLDNPRRWYPNGYGDQPLYTITATLYLENELISRYSVKHGVREIGIDDSFLSEEEGNRFAVTVNGIPIFCKGANWVPADHIPANVTAEKYDRLLSSAREGNYNMLRVWGGGIYEDDKFYELCDEYGILLWQDFIFANAYYPTDDSWFADNVKREVGYVIHKLRNHASIAMWCGNNEIQWQHHILIANMPVFYGKDIYDEIIPSLLEKYDRLRPYRPSSPYSYREINNVGSDRDGDTHSWYIWLGLDTDFACDTDNFLKDKSKFASEYGVQSYACYESIREFLCGDVSLSGEAFDFHKNTQEMGNIRRMLERYYVDDVNDLGLRQQIHFSQYMQGETYRLSIEHFTRRAPFCMGVLYWMYNDCWGTTSSWTCIEYNTRKKASWYIVARAYSPVLATMLCREKILRWHLVQNTGKQQQLSICYGLAGFDGSRLLEKSTSYDLPTSEAVEVDCFETTELSEGYSESDVYAFASVTDATGRVVYKSTGFLVPYKDLNLPDAYVKVQLENNADSVRIRVATDRYAVNLFLETPDVEFCDNGFDLEPGEERILTVTGDENAVKTLSKTNLTAFVLNGAVEISDIRIN